jgi:hypothetical protein
MERVMRRLPGSDRGSAGVARTIVALVGGPEAVRAVSDGTNLAP